MGRGAGVAADVEEHEGLGSEAGCKERSWGMAKAVQGWRVQPELVHLTEDGNKKARNGRRRDQG